MSLATTIAVQRKCAGEEIMKSVQVSRRAFLKANGLGEQIEVAFFPDNQLGQEIDVINSVKLGVIDLMVSGSSISANLVPLVGTFDLGYLFSSFPQQTKAFDAGASKPIEDALLKGANIRIIGWAYNFGARSVLARKAAKTPEDLAGLKIGPCRIPSLPSVFA